MSASPPLSKQRRAGAAASGGGSLLQSALFELRPRLQSAYCFLHLAVDTADSTLRLLSVETRDGEGTGGGGVDVSLEYRGAVYEERVRVDSRFEGLSGAVACEGRYVTLRTRLQPDRRRGSATVEVVTPLEDDSESPVEPLWRPESGTSHLYSLACRQCGDELLRQSFRRVLPLPSENWREMLGNVFCHGDGADANIHERVRARTGDCFYAESHCVVALTDLTGCDVSGGADVNGACGVRGATDVNGPVDARSCNDVSNGDTAANGSVDDGIAGDLPPLSEPGADNRLKCGGCGVLVGEKIEFGSRIWHHCVVWSCKGPETTSEVPDLRLQPGDVLRRLLVHRAATCDAPAARLLATAPRHPPLLLWLVEPRLTVHVTSQCDGGAARRRALKLLWRVCEEEEAKLHRADLQVSALELDEALMVTLLAELRDSLRWYPESQRTVGGDQLGLLLL